MRQLGYFNLIYLSLVLFLNYFICPPVSTTITCHPCICALAAIYVRRLQVKLCEFLFWLIHGFVLLIHTTLLNDRHASCDTKYKLLMKQILFRAFVSLMTHKICANYWFFLLGSLPRPCINQCTQPDLLQSSESIVQFFYSSWIT